MAETRYSRSRTTSLVGLLLQALGSGAMFGLAYATHSTAMQQLGWYLLGGLPLWFVTLLVYRQHELAALEKLDLEELRRQKAATGGGEAIFDADGGGGLGFLVAESRLRWMERWLIPAFGLLAVGYLVAGGLLRWGALERGIRQPGWPALANVGPAMVALALLMLVLFLYARYAAGMGRVPEWRLLRGCGSYMLGNAVATMAIIVCLGARLYAGTQAWEHALAYAVPLVMILLGAEIFLNFVLDIYRPRAPGTLPRACFDSRILGLLSEPGGIARTLAEALNYQFGFEVSQTWFYQLLRRAALPLIAVGLLSLWALSCLVVVQPHERAIIERFGRQLNADHPLRPGLRWKLPWPIDRAYKYNIGQLYQVDIGVKQAAAPRRKPRAETGVELWTDREHRGFEHWDLLVAPAPTAALPAQARPGGQAEAVPVHLMRMDVVVQYKIRPDRLAAYTRSMVDPHAALRDVAWDEVLRFNASACADALLGELRARAGQILQARINRRLEELHLGLAVVYVGLHGVHPAPDVAKAFRKVVSAWQEKVAKIRQARVTENEVLSAVAGDRRRALALVRAINNAKGYSDRLDRAERVLAGLAEPLPAELAGRLEALRPHFLRLIEARWRLERARQQYEQLKSEFELGLGGGPRQVAAAAQQLQAERSARDEAAQALAQALKPLRASLGRRLSWPAVEALVGAAQARVGLEFWNGRMEAALLRLGGQAAVRLAEAQARRWEQETRTAGQVAALQNEHYAYRAAPEIYKARRYLEVLVNGVKDTRKYFYAFNRQGREIHTRIEAQEQARPEITALPARPER